VFLMSEVLLCSGPQESGDAFQQILGTQEAQRAQLQG
jgi:hypothetical protein